VCPSEHLGQAVVEQDGCPRATALFKATINSFVVAGLDRVEGRSSEVSRRRGVIGQMMAMTDQAVHCQLT